MFEGYIEGIQDHVFDFFNDGNFSTDFEELFIAGSEETGWITQVLEFASALDLEVFALLAEARGFHVVILSIVALVGGGIAVTLGLRPKRSGPRPEHS